MHHAGRDQHGDAAEAVGDPLPLDKRSGASPKEAMRDKLRTADGRAVYKMRKAIAEPVFGQIKEQRGFRRFSLRGKENVGREVGVRGEQPAEAVPGRSGPTDDGISGGKGIRVIRNRTESSHPAPTAWQPAFKGRLPAHAKR